jgi:membrane-anchored mycosin MYCP
MSRLLVAVAVLLGAAVPVLGAAGPAAADTPCQQPEVTGKPLPNEFKRDPMIARLGLERVWRLSKGKGVRVAVFDTGLDLRHQPKLTSAVLLPGLELTSAANRNGYVPAPFNGRADCDRAHGTSVTSLIAARPGNDNRMVGIAPEAKVVPIRSVDQIGRAPDTLLAAGIIAAADRADVINLSWATPANYPSVQRAIDYALRKNRVVVAAANNESVQAGQNFYPAAYKGVLAVNAVKPDGTPVQPENRQSWIGIAAPGYKLTALAADTGYLAVDGTSYATAVVSGVAALVRARFPQLPAAEVVQRLINTAVPLGAPADQVGAGMVDPFAALTGQGLPAPSASPVPSKAGSLAVQPLPERPLSVTERWGRMLAWAGVLGLAAVLAYLARLAVRAAIRRRWRAGDVPVPDESPYRPALDPPDVRLL